MKILAFESSCDETAAAVVADGREVLSNVIHTQIDIHKFYGGVVPEIASRAHIEMIDAVAKSALSQARLTLAEIDAIAVTANPGLIGSLLVGVNFAKSLAWERDLPLIPVNHIKGHIAANYLAHAQLTPPFVCLVASGGHSHIVRVDGYTDFTVLARTRDDAAGEAFDKVARAMGLPYPGGVEIDRIYRQGNAAAISLPVPKVRDGKYDFSFSGVKTAVVNLIHHLEQKGEKIPVYDIAAAFSQLVSQTLSERLILAAKDAGRTHIAIAGGVAANSALREELTRRCRQEGMTLYIPPLALCTDNAAMIGAQAYYEYQNGGVADWALNASANAKF